MRLLFASLILVASAAIEPGPIFPAAHADQVDVSKIGPAVGATAPVFSLPDQQGRTQTLSSVAGPKGTMLVFFRSADW